MLPAARFDEELSYVTVRLPEPWEEDQEGLLLAPDVIVAVDRQDGAPRIEALTHARARGMFPREFDPLTQHILDSWFLNR